MTLGVADFKLAGTVNIKTPLTHVESLSFERVNILVMNSLKIENS